MIGTGVRPGDRRHPDQLIRSAVQNGDTGRVLTAVVAQHADGASDLWCQRNNLLRAPHYTLRTLIEHDERLEAYIDGLRVAGEHGWSVAQARLRPDDPGAVFVAGTLALQSKCPEYLESLLSLAEVLATAQRALVSAFGWSTPDLLQGTVKELLAAPTSFRRRIGLACCAIHRVDPRESLTVALDQSDGLLRARALRAAGELGRRDFASRCVGLAQTDGEQNCRFWAAWAAVLLGEGTKGVAPLAKIGTVSSPLRSPALRLSLQAMSVAAGHQMLQEVAAEQGQLRLLIEGSGIVGDPSYVPWLVSHMANKRLARCAGEAFTLITGLDLSQLQLKNETQDALQPGPNDDPEDPDVDMGPDEGLPLPEQEHVQRWWDANRARFQSGQRYFMGAPVTRDHCIDVLKSGCQRQRILAAHYLCLLEPGTPLFNTSAPAWRQQRLLAHMQ
jgi:uncharacterized protein (TIGR02270 family)